MRITIVGDDWISRQARTYAEYRLFAAVSAVLDTSRVSSASVVLRRAKSRQCSDGVVCTVIVELNGGDVTRLSMFGEHPYAAINLAVDRFCLNSPPRQHDTDPACPKSAGDAATERRRHDDSGCA